MTETTQKEIKVFVCVNTLTSVQSPVYENHQAFFCWSNRNLPHVKYHFWVPYRLSIDNARNTAAELAMRHECDYLLFIDDDVLIPVDALKYLIDADKDIVAGLVIIRGYPFNVMAFKWDENRMHLDFYNDLPKDEEGNLVPLIPVDAVGFSCCLIKVDIFNAMYPPYFVTGKMNTEDIYFCVRAQDELAPKPTIYMDTRIQCDHLLNPEGVNWRNREKMKEFYKEAFERQNQSFKRDVLYIKYCVEEVEKAEVVPDPEPAI